MTDLLAVFNTESAAAAFIVGMLLGWILLGRLAMFPWHVLQLAGIAGLTFAVMLLAGAWAQGYPGVTAAIGGIALYGVHWTGMAVGVKASQRRGLPPYAPPDQPSRTRGDEP